MIDIRIQEPETIFSTPPKIGEKRKEIYHNKSWERESKEDKSKDYCSNINY